MLVPAKELHIKTDTPNMEFGEQVLRGGVAMIMLETVLLTSALPPQLIAGFVFTALYLAFTAIIGRDPVYALAIRVQSRDVTAKASVKPYPSPTRPGIALEYRDAA